MSCCGIMFAMQTEARKQMKAIAKVAPQKGVELVEKPMPEMGINDVLIKIKKTAICGTDVHIYEWNAWAQEEIKPPLTIGHEYVGEVVDVGSNVKSVKVGERVSGEGHIVCGHCRNYPILILIVIAYCTQIRKTKKIRKYVFYKDAIDLHNRRKEIIKELNI